MSVYENTFVSFVSENGRYCVGRVLKLGTCSLVMSPLEKCRIPEMDEAGSVVINLGGKRQVPLAVTAWAKVGESGANCVEFYFNDIDSRARELIQQLKQSLKLFNKKAA